jgi:hypothetical protein
VVAVERGAPACDADSRACLRADTLGEAAAAGAGGGVSSGRHGADSDTAPTIRQQPAAQKGGGRRGLARLSAKQRRQEQRRRHRRLDLKVDESFDKIAALRRRGLPEKLSPGVRICFRWARAEWYVATVKSVTSFKDWWFVEWDDKTKNQVLLSSHNKSAWFVLHSREDELVISALGRAQQHEVRGAGPHPPAPAPAPAKLHKSAADRRQGLSDAPSSSLAKGKENAAGTRKPDQGPTVLDSRKRKLLPMRSRPDGGEEEEGMLKKRNRKTSCLQDDSRVRKTNAHDGGPVLGVNGMGDDELPAGALVEVSCRETYRPVADERDTGAHGDRG